MPNSNKAKRIKPAKPYPDFPLFPHASGRWAKKVRGRLVYFGKWEDPQAALDKWLAEKDYLLAGRKPPAVLDGLTLKDLCNRFLTAKQRRVETGEMTQRSWVEYKLTCEAVIQMFGKGRLVSDLTPDDFGQLRAYLGKGRNGQRSLESLSGWVQRTRSLFKWAYESNLIDRPVKFGPDFKQPSREAKRKERNRRPPRIFTPDEIRRLIDAATVPMRAMIYLGINCGFGNSDCAELPRAAVDLDAGLVDFPREKTGVERRATLWPETVKALREAIATRPAPADKADAGLVFITRHGRRWVRYTATGNVNSVTREFEKLLAEAGIDRAGVSFYALRHTFETVAGAAGDQVAVDRIMGHVTPGISDSYRHWLKDEAENERLRKVTGHVRAWLFQKPAKPTGKV